MITIGKILAMLGGLTMAFGLFCLAHTIWSAHLTGSWLSNEVFLWQGRSFVAYLGYGIAMVGCLIWRAAAPSLHKEGLVNKEKNDDTNTK